MPPGALCGGVQRAARNRARMPSRSIDPGPFVLCCWVTSSASLIAARSRSFSTVSRSTRSMSWFCGFVIRRPGKARSLPNRIGHTRADSARTCRLRMPTAPTMRNQRRFSDRNCACRWHQGCIWEERRLRYVAVLRRASDKSVLGRICLRGASDAKHNRGREINAQQLLPVRMRARHAVDDQWPAAVAADGPW